MLFHEVKIKVVFIIKIFVSYSLDLDSDSAHKSTKRLVSPSIEFTLAMRFKKNSLPDK